jgi:predicted ribosome quality control (RQC) complex YloA/Tae2 family protein
MVMSLNRNAIYNLIHQLKESILGACVESIQETSPFKWIFILKKQSTFYRLLFCLKAPLSRFHLVSISCKTYDTPVTQSWLSFLNHFLLDSIEMAGDDRILKILFRKGSTAYTLVFEVFPQRPNLYLLDANQNILHSFNPVKQTLYHPPKNLKENEPLQLDPSMSHYSIEQLFEEKENELAFNVMKHRIQSELQQKVKKNSQGQKKCLADLERCHRWNDIQHEGVLLQANLYRLDRGMKEVEVSDWEKEGRPTVIALNARRSPHQEIEFRFKLSKKLKNGWIHQQKILEKLQEEVKKLESLVSEGEKLTNLASLETFASKLGMALEPPSPKEKPPKTLPYHEFKSASGFSIWVGKNARANEKLTFSYAKGSDWWLHVNDFPGSHVIIRVQKKQQPDEETLQDALQVALAYSKAKDRGEGEICVTQCKYVSRLGKNQPGKVQISHHKTLYVKFDSARFQHIKNRN